MGNKKGPELLNISPESIMETNNLGASAVRISDVFEDVDLSTPAGKEEWLRRYGKKKPEQE